MCTFERPSVYLSEFVILFEFLCQSESRYPYPFLFASAFLSATSFASQSEFASSSVCLFGCR